MLLRFDDVEAAGSAIDVAGATPEIVQRGERRDHAIEEGFGNRLAVLVRHRVGQDVRADVAHKQQAAPRQHEPRAVGGRIFAIGVELSVHAHAAFVERRGQRAAHDAAPISIDDGLVRRIDGCDGVFAIHDRRDGALEHHVLYARAVLLADRMIAVDDDVDVQTVIAQQHVRRADRRRCENRPAATGRQRPVRRFAATVQASLPSRMESSTTSDQRASTSGTAASRNPSA